MLGGHPQMSFCQSETQSPLFYSFMQIWVATDVVSRCYMRRLKRFLRLFLLIKHSLFRRHSLKLYFQVNLHCLLELMDKRCWKDFSWKESLKKNTFACFAWEFNTHGWMCLSFWILNWWGSAFWSVLPTILPGGERLSRNLKCWVFSKAMSVSYSMGSTL